MSHNVTSAAQGHIFSKTVCLKKKTLTLIASGLLIVSCISSERQALKYQEGAFAFI